jgi:hypothetical protein
LNEIEVKESNQEEKIPVTETETEKKDEDIEMINTCTFK